VKQTQELKMMKLIVVATVATMVSGAAFAQAGANPNAPQPSADGRGVSVPGTTSTGVAVDRPDMKGGMTTSGTTGLSGTSQQGGTSKDGMGQQNKGGMSK
jgi:hypothetical protein